MDRFSEHPHENGQDFSWSKPEEKRPDVEVREQTVEKLRATIEAWVQEHIPEERECTQRDLKALLQILESEHRDQIDLLSQQMKNQELFPEARPSLELFRQSDRLPRVVLYGWRKHANMLTPSGAHDHGESLGAIFVHEGALRERVFGIDREQWEAHRKSGRAYGYFPLKNAGAKTLSAGQSKTFRAPYIHDVEADTRFDFSSSLHAYSGPKGVSANFSVQGDELVMIERK